MPARFALVARRPVDGGHPSIRSCAIAGPPPLPFAWWPASFPRRTSSVLKDSLQAQHRSTNLLGLRHLLLLLLFLRLLQLCFQRGDAVLHVHLPCRLRVELLGGMGLADLPKR